jgi:hypothetical protein
MTIDTLYWVMFSFLLLTVFVGFFSWLQWSHFSVFEEKSTYYDWWLQCVWERCLQLYRGSHVFFPTSEVAQCSCCSCQASRQSSGCLLLLEASGSYWNLHCARIRVRSERRVLISHHSDSIAGFLFESIVSREGYVLTVTGMWKQDLSCSDNNLTIGERHARNHGFFQEVQLGLHDSILRLKVEALRLHNPYYLRFPSSWRQM